MLNLQIEQNLLRIDPNEENELRTMFVSSLLGDWWRTQDHNRTVGNNNSTNRQDTNTASTSATSTSNSSTYEEFLEHQKKTWTPIELYEKCCPRFLAGGGSKQTKNGQFVCAYAGSGGRRRRCDKIHPTITLYFDATKQCTIATPSQRLDPFLEYLDRRVGEKSAVAKSPYYYELDGFVRDNLHRLRHQQRLFGGHLVKVALGALKESDAAQAALLEDSHLRRHLRRHRRGHGRGNRNCNPSFPPSDRCFDDSAKFALSCSSSSSMETKTKSSASSPSYYQAVERLETVLEICRLWGIGDHLDVLSIDCMLQTSRVFRKVAIPMAQQRVRDCKFVVTPLVDGHYATGYSIFRRGANDNRRKVFEREHDRLVEYAVCPSMVLLHCGEEIEGDNQESSSDNKNIPASRNTTAMSGRYLPEFRARSNVGSSSNRNDTETKGSAGFSWACEELSLANLELECMDIGLHEYMGQKVIVRWRRCEVDIPNPRHASARDDDENDRDRDYIRASTTSVARYESSPTSADQPVFRLVLGWAPRKVGIVDLSVPHFALKLDVSKNCASQVDDVTFSYEGNARILECRADFCFLVAAYARSLQPYLATEHRQIETKRPLLRHEKEFLGHVQNATSLCPVLSSYL